MFIEEDKILFISERVGLVSSIVYLDNDFVVKSESLSDDEAFRAIKKSLYREPELFFIELELPHGNKLIINACQIDEKELSVDKDQIYIYFKSIPNQFIRIRVQAREWNKIKNALVSLHSISPMRV